MVGSTGGLLAQRSADNTMTQGQSYVGNQKSNNAFALPKFLRSTAFKPRYSSQFVSSRATEARARAAQYAYYIALRDKSQEAAMEMGSEIRLIAGAASLLRENRVRHTAINGNRVPGQEQNETRTEKGKKRAGRANIRESPTRKRKSASGPE